MIRTKNGKPNLLKQRKHINKIVRNLSKKLKSITIDYEHKRSIN